MTQNNSKRYQLVLWLQTRGLPEFQRRSARLINRLTADPSRQHWSALQPSSSWSRWILWTMVGLAGFGIVWSCFARIDETVQATGKLEPKGVTKEVKAPLGGVIAEILVRDGDVVEKNQTLLILDTEAAKAKLKALKIVRDRVRADLMLSQAQLGERPRLESLNSNQVGKLVALQAEYASRIDASRQSVRQAERAVDSITAQLRASESSLVIRRQIIKDIRPLEREGAMARSQFLKEYQEYLMLEGDVKSKRAELKRVKSALAEARQKLINTQALTRVDFSSKVEEGQKQLAELENQISETGLTLKYQRLKAPVSGVVFDLKPTAPGYVVSGNVPEPVLKIVPNDQLVARIFITNKDIGFIKIGQKVQVRIDAFPYNEFGDVNGNISKVGSDVLPPDQTYNFFRFPVTVGMQRNYLSYRGRSLRLVSGMSVTANIILRQRPVIAIFTQQILPFWDSLQKL
jgi:hemolysin D